jgi:hypothetical protein
MGAPAAAGAVAKLVGRDGPGQAIPNYLQCY